MKCEWESSKIGDLGKIITGKTPPTKNQDLWDGNIPFITPRDLQNGKTVLCTERTITSNGIKVMQSVKLPPKSVCVSCIGNIGYVAMTRSECISNQQINSIIVNSNNDADFVYYLMKSLHSTFKNYEGQSTTLSILNKKHFSDIDICIPPLDIQKQIAAILSALDEKIAINRAINDNLEQQAQAFFQELFVDNADPEWAIGTINDLGAVVGGSTPSKAKPEYYTETGIAWITPKDLSVNKSKFISHGENDITELGLKNSSATIMPEGTVLFSSRAPIGYIAVAAGEVATNQGFKSIVPKPEIGTAFVYYFLKHNLPIIEGMASGSTFKEVSGSTMKGVPAVIPDTDIIARFNDFCSPIFAQQRILEEQNHSLAALRDNLLPKLMSGELDVSAVEF